MFGWFATRVVDLCGSAPATDVERRWSAVEPSILAQRLPACGTVLYLGCPTPQRCKARLAAGLLAARGELSPLLETRWLVAATVIDSDGAHEWLECRACDGRLCARLHLLPDTDYLGWDSLLVPAGQGATAARQPRLSALAPLPGSAQLLAFRWQRLGGLGVLDATPAASLSALGIDTARRIARAEGLRLAA